MRFVARFILVIFFVILFLVGLLAGTFKFQLLDYSFWQRSLAKNNVYKNLAAVTRNSLEFQAGKEGGSKDDVKVLTDLVTTENVRDFLDKNLKNILSFANGESSQIIVYIPIKIIPKSLLPNNLSGIQNEIPLQDLLAKLNYQNYQSLPLRDLGRLGRSATLVFTGLMSLLAVTMVLLTLLVREESRLIAPGIAVFLSGFLTLALSKTGGIFTNSMSSGNLSGESSFVSVLAGSLLPPLAGEFMKTWSAVGITLMIIGLVLFFVRKPRYNIPK